MPTCGTLTVTAPFDASKVTVTDCPKLSPSSVAPGDTVNATVTVQNQNGSKATLTVEVVSNGTTLGSQQVTVGANTSTSATIGFQAPGEGTYSLTAQKQSGSVTQG